MDYGGTAKELEAYFNHCGEVQRVTILCDKFSGHPKGSVQGQGEGAWHPRVLPSMGHSGCALTSPCPTPAMPT